jgi:hypothetical protein
MAIDRRSFFRSIRPLFGSLRQEQVDGMDAILNGWEGRAPNGDIRWLAYMFATAFHETNRTMQPVREAYWLSEQWRKNNLRYYPYYGRGYVQLTWRENYKRAGDFVGVNLVQSPDLAMDAENAAIIMFVGMDEGWFRGDARGRQTLARYFSNAANDPVGAREIINGREVKTINGRRVLLANIIADYHESFRRALAAARDATESVFVESAFEEGVFSDGRGLESVGAAGDLVESVYAAAPQEPSLVDQTVEIVTAFLASNEIRHSDVPELIVGVHQALASLVAPPPGGQTQLDWSEPIASEDGDGSARQPPSERSRRKRGTKEKAVAQ